MEANHSGEVHFSREDFQVPEDQRLAANQPGAVIDIRWRAGKIRETGAWPQLGRTNCVHPVDLTVAEL